MHKGLIPVSPTTVITSRDNPVVRQARSLRDRPGRRKSGHFLIEGIHPVGVAIEAEWPIEVVLYSPELLTSPYGRGLVEQFKGRAEELSGPVFASVSSKENPQGILAIAKRRNQGLDSAKPESCGAALVSPQDPGNVGTILRTLDAVGGSALYVLDGGVDPFHPTVVRAAMGASFAVPIVEASFADFDAWRRGRGLQLIGSSAHAATDYRGIRPLVPWVVLMGNEQKGLSGDQQQACDVVVRLPMLGRASSLNLAVAAGILLFAYVNTDPG